MIKLTGGPAFPSTLQYFPDDTNHIDESGMTLRDYFAAKAMAAILSNSHMFKLAEERHINVKEVVYNTVREAYELADAMLKERAK